MPPVKKLKLRSSNVSLAGGIPKDTPTIGQGATAQIGSSITTQAVKPITPGVTRQNNPKYVPYTRSSMARQSALVPPQIVPPVTPQVTPLTNIESMPRAASQEARPVDPDVESDTSSQPQIRKRGPTVGLGTVDDVVRQNKLPLELKPGDKRFTGQWAKKYGSEVAMISRRRAPVRFEKWHDIPFDIRRDLCYLLTGTFQLDMKDPIIIELVEQHLGERWRDFRSKCHAHYLLFNDEPIEVRKANKYHVDISQADWEWLCDWKFRR